MVGQVRDQWTQAHRDSWWAGASCARLSHTTPRLALPSSPSLSAMPPTHEEHKAQGPQSVRCAVITVSDTRTIENDTGGQTVIDHLQAAGHSVVSREIIPDEPARMRPLLASLSQRDDVDVILMTGGT